MWTGGQKFFVFYPKTVVVYTGLLWSWILIMNNNNMGQANCRQDLQTAASYWWLWWWWVYRLMPLPQQNPVNRPVETRIYCSKWSIAELTVSWRNISVRERERNVYWGRALPARSLMYGSTHAPPHKHSCPSANNSNMSEGGGEKPAKDTDKQTKQRHKPRCTKLITHCKNTVSKGFICIQCCSFCMRVHSMTVWGPCEKNEKGPCACSEYKNVT